MTDRHELADGRPPAEGWIGSDDGRRDAHAVLLQAAGTPQETCAETVVEARRGVVGALR